MNMSLPLTKTLDPHDFALLEPEMRTVDQFFTKAREQHPMRRWEYALALKARHAWLQWDYEEHGHGNRAHGHRIVDVGGAGSPFQLMLNEDSGQSITVIDPDGGMALDQFLRWRGNLAHEVYCLSVLEHVDELEHFLYHLNCLVAPGGLLFLTLDCCHGEQIFVQDVYHFHWMRKRIFSRLEWNLLEVAPPMVHFKLFGQADWAHHGNHVYDYTFASLALVKRS
jgi:hypothetical protein